LRTRSYSLNVDRSIHLGPSADKQRRACYARGSNVDVRDASELVFREAVPGDAPHLARMNAQLIRDEGIATA
jgi:hypothetical protein